MTQFDQTIDSESIQVNAQGNVQKVDLAIDPGLDAGTEDVPSSELNAWNGRLAMIGLSVGMGVLLLVRIASP